MGWLVVTRRARGMLLLVGAAAVGALSPLATVGCSDTENQQQTGAAGAAGATGGSGAAAGSGGEGGEPSKEKVVTLHPAADPLPGETECTVVITTGIAVGNSAHVPLCTPVDYATNPPSGGPHWPKWAAFKTYATPVPREMYVHDMEHGAVVLAYRCADPCPDVVDFFAGAVEDFALDPLCVASGLQHRVVVTPDPELDTPVAAAAWGATYTATCLDRESLDEFMSSRYGKGTEQTCAQGTAVDGDAGVDCEGGPPDGG